MRVKFILPALTDTASSWFRPLKYSLFPPLGLATLAGYLDPSDEAVIEDENVQNVSLDDDPELVVIQVYISSAKRAYAMADFYRRRGAHVCLGGLHVTALPEEAAAHADTIFLGPGEDTWPVFLEDFRAGRPGIRYASRERSLACVPPIRRDLLRRDLYVIPNALVVSRGCPHLCDFCYKDAFFRGGSSYYTRRVDSVLGEIAALPSGHLHFLDDHLLGAPGFASALFDGMAPMKRLWLAASTVRSVLEGDTIVRAAKAGLRCLFIGFETLDGSNLRQHGKVQNLGEDYERAIKRLHDLGIMVHASFVFGMDSDGPDVFDRTVDWAVRRGVESATFHVLTPYPGTGLYQRLELEGRLLHKDWERYDTRQVVFRPRGMTAEQLEEGHWRAYRDFFSWANIFRAATKMDSARDIARHLAYAVAWRKMEPVWDWIIRTRRAAGARPLLDSILAGFRGDGQGYGGSRASLGVKKLSASP